MEKNTQFITVKKNKCANTWNKMLALVALTDTFMTIRHVVRRDKHVCDNNTPTHVIFQECEENVLRPAI